MILGAAWTSAEPNEEDEQGDAQRKETRAIPVDGEVEVVEKNWIAGHCRVPTSKAPCSNEKLHDRV